MRCSNPTWKKGKTFCSEETQWIWSHHRLQNKNSNKSKGTIGNSEPSTAKAAIEFFHVRFNYFCTRIQTIQMAENLKLNQSIVSNKSSLLSAFSVIVFGLDFDDFFKLRLIKIFSCILENVFGLFFKHFKQKYRNHVLEFWVFSQICLIINSVLNLFLVENASLSFCKAFDSNNVVLVVILLVVIHVVDMVIVKLFLLFLLGFLAHGLAFETKKESLKL